MRQSDRSAEAVSNGGYFRVPDRLIDDGLWARMRPRERTVYIALRRRAPNVRPSIPRIAKDAGLHTRSVRQAIKELEDRQLLTVERSWGSGNRYQLRALAPLGAQTPRGAKETITEGVGTPLRATSRRVTKKEDKAKAATRSPSTLSGDAHTGQEAPPPPGFDGWSSRAADIFGAMTLPTLVKARVLYARALASGRSEQQLLDVIAGAAVKLQRPEPFRKARDLRWVLSPEGIADCLAEKRRSDAGKTNGRGAPVFRQGVEAEAHRRAMRDVVQRPAGFGNDK